MCSYIESIIIKQKFLLKQNEEIKNAGFEMNHLARFRL